MSLFTLNNRFLSLSPKVEMVDGKLHSRSNLLFSLLTLFLLFKRVTVDPVAKTVTLHRQILWLFPHTSKIDFQDVQKIDYDYSSLPTNWGIFFGTKDEVEWFTVRLRLYTGKRVNLWTFFGEGAVETGWAGTFFGGDEAVDFAGTQEEDSRYFVKALEFFLKKPINLI